MLLKKFLVLSPWLLGAYANNSTVAFFPSSEEATCKQDNIANTITLTTDTIPSGYVCFNMTDLFTQSSDNGSQGLWHHENDTTSQGVDQVDYLLSNRGFYNADTNYTNVWYQQVNQSGGTDGAWTFYTYAFSDCLQVGGDNYENKDFPWFETSCSTKEGGQCQQLPQPIKSFAINQAAIYNAGHNGKCEVWAKMGDASTLSRQTPALLVVAATMTVLLVL